MSEGNAKGVNWTFETIFWTAIVVITLSYISYGLIPQSDDISEQEALLAARRGEAARLEAELARTRATISALTGEGFEPETAEREMRNRLGYHKPGETRIPISGE
jgi:cell division protein FtsB